MMQPNYNYNISEELFSAIEQNFSGIAIANKYIESRDKSLFEKWGKEWMDHTYNLSIKPEYNDHMFDMIKLAYEKTKEAKFPHEAQRFIEIANLAIHYMPVLLIQTANNKELSYSVEAENCSIYQQLRERLTATELELLPCKLACLTALIRIFKLLEIKDVIVSQIQKIPKDGLCTFLAKKE
ncbi:MAG: hypothetical protein ACFFKA_03280 [Candidatus Thorarchaeota archaeon]